MTAIEAFLREQDKDRHHKLARMFILSKKRLPIDDVELKELLVEFTELVYKQLELAMEIHREHLMICNRPIILKKD